MTMETTHEGGKSASGIGRAVTVVDASIFDCAGWELQRTARGRLKSHYEGGGEEL